MKDITKYFMEKKVIFKEFEELLPKELKSKKRVKIFVASSTDLKFYAIFKIDSKSRFIKKSADELISLCELLANYVNYNFKVKALFLQSEICSTTKLRLKEQGWIVVKS